MAFDWRIPLRDDLPPMLADVPRILGYGAVAAMTPRRLPNGSTELDAAGQPVMLRSTTISSYLFDSMDRGDWRYVPKPDIVLLREGGKWSPGWYVDTIKQWHLTGRPGAGNHARGVTRLAQRGG
jgi:hypothetical protein